MKHSFFIKLGKWLSVIICILLLPPICTLLLQGVGDDGIQMPQPSVEQNQEQVSFDESILPGILANQISVNAEAEAIKAQAVIARTNCLWALKNGEEMPKGLTEEEMLRLWGKDNYSLYYDRLQECIEATGNEVILYNGQYIRADFHAVSAGYTRNAEEIYGNTDYPYLQSVDSRTDIISSDFLKVEFYTLEEFIKKGEEFFSEDMQGKTPSDILNVFQITKKDSAGYVLEVTIGDKKFSGEEIRLVYDWNSAAFSIKEVDGEIRVVTKGYGHGLGLSMYGASALAAEGYSYKEILAYYYKEISIENTTN